MKWSTFGGVVVAASAIALVGRTLFAPPEPTAGDILTEVMHRVSQSGFDDGKALRDIERAYEDARSKGDDDVAVALLSLHSRILFDIGAYRDARADVERILNSFRPGDPTFLLRAAELRAMEGATVESRDMVERLLDDHPDFGAAWSQLGDLERVLGAEQLALAERVAHEVLVSADAEDADVLIRQLAARTPDDSERVSLATTLRELFDTRRADHLDRVLNAVDQASLHSTAALEAYASSFADGLEPDAVTAFLELLVLAEREDMAVDFGLLARALPAIRTDYRIQRILMRALESLGRDDDVKRLAVAWAWDEYPGDAAFYEDATRILYRTGGWNALTPPCQRLFTLGHDRERAFGNFFLGVAYSELNRPEAALQMLHRYLGAGRPEEPFSGAIGRAYLAQAKAFGAAQNPRERESLEGAVARLESVDGEVWLRIAELQMQGRNIGYRSAESRWAKGMSLLPQRTEELMPRWTQIGRKALAAEGLDIQQVMNRIKRQGLSIPAFDAGPHTLYQVGQEHLAENRDVSALKVGRRLIALYPGLVPGQDLVIESYLRRGQEKLAAQYVLERLALVGRDETSAGFLERLGDDPFSPAQQLEIMRADPRGTGRLVMARTQLAAGDFKRALRTIQGDEADEPSLEERVVSAQILLKLGRTEDAVLALRGLAGTPQFKGEALETLLEARLLQGATAQVKSLMNRIAGMRDLDPGFKLSAADRLLADDRIPLARDLLLRMDGEFETRSGEVLMRLALVHALLQERETAYEDIERAEATVADGRPELVRLLFTIEDRAWTELADRVAELQDSDRRPSKVRRAILALLEERLEAGLEMAVAGLEAKPHSAEWAVVLGAAQELRGLPIELPPYFGDEAPRETRLLLRGRGEVHRDPREVLALLLALELPGWSGWVHPRVVHLNEEAGGTLWPRYLEGRVLAEMGRDVPAQGAFATLLERHPTFGPAWDAAEDVLRKKAADAWAPKVVELRGRRLAALGEELAGTPLEVAVDRAADLAREGKGLEAVTLLGEARVDEPDAPHGLDLFARLAVQAGQLKRAVLEYGRACDALASRSDQPFVAEYLSVLDESASAKRQPLPPERHRISLTRLEERFPRDPLVALAVASFELSVALDEPEKAVGQALARLDDFRRVTAGSSLESLRSGSASAWGQFLVEFAPDRAEALAREELLDSPGELDLWLLLARSLQEQRKIDEAFEAYDTVVAMSSDAKAHRNLAWLLVERGGDGAAVRKHLRASQAGADAKTTARSLLIGARSELQSTEPAYPSILNTLEQLWARRKVNERQVPPVVLGSTYATALLGRRHPEDLKRAKTLLRELEESTVTTYETVLVRSLRGLGLHIEPREPQPKTEETEEAGSTGEGEGAEEATERRGGKNGKEPEGADEAATDEPAEPVEKPETDEDSGD